MVHPYLNEVYNIRDLKVGDCIKCDYIATSNTYGDFSNLGNAQKPLLPSTPTTITDGSFYFIMVGYDVMGRMKLIADRNIQSGISTDVLNANYVVNGITPSIYNKKLIPVFTDNNPVDDISIFSSEELSINYITAYAFDNNAGFTDSGGYSRWVSSSTQPAYIGVIFNKKTKIDMYSITIPANNATYTQSPRDWKLQGSNGNDIWVDLHEINDFNNKTSIPAQTLYYKLPESVEYNQYRLYITRNWGGNYHTIIEFNLYETDPEISNLDLELRLLTGGVSTLNTSNEWDKIIVNSDLNGKIIPGDNNIWNWNTMSVTSTVMLGYDSNKVARGGTSVTTGPTTISTSVSNTNTTLRPVLLIGTSSPNIPNIELSNTHIWYTDSGKIKLSLSVRNITDSSAKYKILVNNTEVIPETDLIGPNYDLSIEIPKSHFNQPNNILLFMTKNELGYSSAFTYNIVREDINTESFRREFVFSNQWELDANSDIINNSLTLKNNGYSTVTTDNRTRINTQNKYNIVNVQIQSTEDTTQNVSKQLPMNIIETSGYGEICSLKITTKEFNNKIVNIK